MLIRNHFIANKRDTITGSSYNMRNNLLVTCVHVIENTHTCSQIKSRHKISSKNVMQCKHNLNQVKAAAVTAVVDRTEKVIAT